MKGWKEERKENAGRGKVGTARGKNDGTHLTREKH